MYKYNGSVWPYCGLTAAQPWPYRVPTVALYETDDRVYPARRRVKVTIIDY